MGRTVLALLLLAACGPAQAQERRFYDRDGSYAGSARQGLDGDTRFYDRNGARTGTARPQADGTRFYGPDDGPRGVLRGEDPSGAGRFPLRR